MSQTSGQTDQQTAKRLIQSHCKKSTTETVFAQQPRQSQQCGVKQKVKAAAASAAAAAAAAEISGNLICCARLTIGAKANENYLGVKMT